MAPVYFSLMILGFAIFLAGGAILLGFIATFGAFYVLLLVL
jgi:hypothetical protein